MMLRNFQTRPVTEDDWELLLYWRNDPLTRAHSFSHEAVDAAAHRAWLRGRLQDSACSFFLILLHQTPVGILRLEQSGGTAKIHYTVAPKERGQGYGSAIIALAETLAPAGVRLLQAEVLADNPASIRCFTRNGYLCTTENGYYLFTKKLPLRR